MKRLNLLLLVFLTAMVPAMAGSTSEPPSKAEKADKQRVSEITNNLVCTCGCANIIVAKCDCGQAAEMTKEVAAFVSRGAGDAEIYQAFEKKYGPAVLGAPKAEGFNALAWVLPFVGLALGGAVVVVVLRRLRRPEGAGTPDAEKMPEPDEETRRYIDEEMREY